MSDLLRKIESELNLLIETPAAQGGIADVININGPAKVGDPGYVIAYDYPLVMVEVAPKDPLHETAGRAGYDVVAHSYVISIVIDIPDYFDPTTSDYDGEEQLEDAGFAMWLWFRRFANRKALGGLEGVRNVVVSGLTFPPQMRPTYVKSATLTLTVERQHQHRP
jgi:hypothetical protein